MARSPQEAQRLQVQAQLFSAHTEYLLRRAGIEPGMRVLDVGCGPGDVSLMTARLVGPEGSVLGVDIDAELVALAEERAVRAGVRNLAFQQGDVGSLTLPGGFDAVVGRFLLTHLSQPAKVLRSVVRQVRPGGLVTFLEGAYSRARTVPSTPLMERGVDWMARTLVAAGGDPDFGESLATCFLDAGLRAPGMAACTAVETDPNVAAAYTAASVRSMLPAAVAFGVTTEEAVGIDTYEERLREEAVAARATFFLPQVIGAWSRN
ncbi:methyltransferase domain-containing protein [Streptomyces sp. NPDC002790]|uniref:class I SAM-dependent methyltransferase n=1 Tax=Streptomyces sp. NPDC002790 TaxID=3154431 RepID=UPI003322727A